MSVYLLDISTLFRIPTLGIPYATFYNRVCDKKHTKKKLKNKLKFLKKIPIKNIEQLITTNNKRYTMLTIKNQLNNLDYVKTQIESQIQNTSIKLYRVCLEDILNKILFYELNMISMESIDRSINSFNDLLEDIKVNGFPEIFN